jgi:hypothetical protein
VKLTRAQIAVLTGTKRADWVASALGHNAAETLTGRCMQAHGLAYYPFFYRPAESATMAALVPGVPLASIGLAARQANGYGFYSRAVREAAHPTPQDQPDRETKYVASLPAKAKQRYLLTLRGPLLRGVGGCMAAATRQVYGSLADYRLATTGWGEMQAQLKPVQADPAFGSVIAKWSACMAAKGYNYPGPDNLYNRLATRIGTAPADRALEIRTAVQDYECSQAVRLIATIRTLQANHARYVSKALARKVARLTRVFARELKVARRLHVVGSQVTSRR